MISVIFIHILIKRYYFWRKNMELELWNIFQSSRGANATMILSVTIGIWIAARFASVARENDAPVLMKAIISIFALSGFAFGWMVITRAVNGWVVQATALSDLRESGTELSPIASQYVEMYGGEFMTNPGPIGMAYLISGLLIALLPLWLKDNK
jgi:hypothetical protein